MLTAIEQSRRAAIRKLEAAGWTRTPQDSLDHYQPCFTRLERLIRLERIHRENGFRVVPYDPAGAIYRDHAHAVANKYPLPRLEGLLDQ
jgi:hypothetical protein